MKKNISTLIICIIFYSNTKSQNDSNAGFYADGIKVNELSCYKFEKLNVLIPYSPTYNYYDQFVILVTVGEVYKFPSMFSGICRSYSKGTFLSYVTGNVINYELIKSDFSFSGKKYDSTVDRASGEHIPSTTQEFRAQMHLAFYSGKAMKQESDLNVTFYGQTIEGYNEIYDQNSGQFLKIPIYKSEKITSMTLHLKNRTKWGNAFSLPTKKDIEKLPCDMPNKDNTKTATASQSNNIITKENSPPTNTTVSKPLSSAKEESTQTEKYKSMYENGTVKEEGEYVGELQNGKWVKYWDNGNIKTITNYEMGKKDGSYEEYRLDGTKIVEEFYKNNLLEGTQKTYFTKNKISEIEIYEDGKKNGPYKKYNFQGYLEETGTFIEGSRHGTWQFLTPDGKVKRIREYDMGKIISDVQK